MSDARSEIHLVRCNIVSSGQSIWGLKRNYIQACIFSCLEEKLLDIDISSERFIKLTKEERTALYNLRDDPTIIIKGAHKGSAVTVLDREDYLKEEPKQSENKHAYEEV